MCWVFFKTTEYIICDIIFEDKDSKYEFLKFSTSSCFYFEGKSDSYFFNLIFIN